jgi:hypothetical protein
MNFESHLGQTVGCEVFNVQCISGPSHNSAHYCIMMMMMMIILVVTFMQGIYNYIPATNHVSRVYTVTAVLYLQFVLHYYYFFVILFGVSDVQFVGIL